MVIIMGFEKVYWVWLFTSGLQIRPIYSSTCAALTWRTAEFTLIFNGSQPLFTFFRKGESDKPVLFDSSSTNYTPSDLSDYLISNYTSDNEIGQVAFLFREFLAPRLLL